jgi:hypothetical protein
MAKFQLKVENKIIPKPKPVDEAPPIPTYESAMIQVYKMRSYLYRPATEQLDMLWHDINEGKIQADTTSANTWYQHVKAVKDSIPLPDANTFSS